MLPGSLHPSISAGQLGSTGIGQDRPGERGTGRMFPFCSHHQSGSRPAGLRGLAVRVQGRTAAQRGRHSVGALSDVVEQPGSTTPVALPPTRNHSGGGEERGPDLRRLQHPRPRLLPVLGRPAPTDADYDAWINAIGGAKAVVLEEPDSLAALPGYCGAGYAAEFPGITNTTISGCGSVEWHGRLRLGRDANHAGESVEAGGYWTPEVAAGIGPGVACYDRGGAVLAAVVQGDGHVVPGTRLTAMQKASPASNQGSPRRCPVRVTWKYRDSQSSPAFSSRDPDSHSIASAL